MSKSRTFFLRLLSFLPLLILLRMVFGFSSQDAETSGSLSFEISLFIVRVLSPLFSAITNENSILSPLLPEIVEETSLFAPYIPAATSEDILIQRAKVIHVFVRKAAHMTEYFLLTLSLHLPFYSCLKQKLSFNKRLIISFFITVCIATIDEFYQTTVPGRSGNFTDVCIDSTGALLATIFLALFFYLKNRKKQKRSIKKQKRLA